VATQLDVRAPEEAPTRPTTWTEALIAWRAAERQLASIPASSPEGNALRAEIEALRMLYKELSGQFAAQATPVPRATVAALAIPVGEPMPAGELVPGPEIKPVGRSRPAARPKEDARPKPVARPKQAAHPTPVARPKEDARPKPAARPKLRPQSARAS
jgi:hypothetical protein